MATAAPHSSIAERLGRVAGRAWQAGMRGRRSLALWLTSKGTPAPLALVLSLLPALVVLGVAAYVALWLVLLAAIAVGAAWVAGSAGVQEQQKPEWREGHAGLGWYDRHGTRVDLGGPDSP